MKNLKYFIALLSLLIALSVLANPPDKEKYSFTDIWDVYIECANNGQGEWLHGEFDVIVIRIYKKDGSYVGNSIMKGAYVTGTQSGEIYHLIRSGHNHSRASDGTFFTHAYHHYVGKKGTQIKVISRTHYGFDENGDYVLYNIEHTLECK